MGPIIDPEGKTAVKTDALFLEMTLFSSRCSDGSGQSVIELEESPLY